jgi:hypothetical protein
MTYTEFKELFHKVISIVHNNYDGYRGDEHLWWCFANYIMEGRDNSYALYHSSEKDIYIRDLLRIKLEGC